MTQVFSARVKVFRTGPAEPSVDGGLFGLGQV